MNNITPPQISEERITQLWDAIPKSWPPTRANRAVFAQAVAAEINRQWLEMLEPVGETDLDGNFFAHDPLPDGTKVYRIKDAGMSKSYTIATLQDMLAVPADRRAAMLTELETAFELLEFAMAELRPGELLQFTWTDDGEHSVSLAGLMGKTFSSWR